jgi:hypothetical protein
MAIHARRGIIRGATSLSILCPAIFLVLGWSSPASATSCTYVLPGNVHDGRVYNPPETTFKVRGAEAQIETRTPDVCTTGPYAFSGGWAMLAADDGNGWAQVGWERHYYTCGTCIRYLWEWTADQHSQPIHTGMYSVSGEPSSGSFHTYTVSRFTSDGVIHLKVDGNNVQCNDEGFCGVTGFDPQLWWTTGCSSTICINGEWFGEASFVDSDLPGSSGSKMDVSVVSEKDGQSPGNWFQKAVDGSSWSGFQDCYWAKQDIYTDSSGFHVWTDPIGHESSDPGGC